MIPTYRMNHSLTFYAYIPFKTTIYLVYVQPFDTNGTLNLHPENVTVMFHQFHHVWSILKLKRYY